MVLQVWPLEHSGPHENYVMDKKIIPRNFVNISIMGAKFLPRDIWLHASTAGKIWFCRGATLEGRLQFRPQISTFVGFASWRTKEGAKHMRTATVLTITWIPRNLESVPAIGKNCQNNFSHPVLIWKAMISTPHLEQKHKILTNVFASGNYFVILSASIIRG